MFNGIPSMAASISFQSDGCPYEALELIELGRGVLISLQIDIRTDITLLEESHPDSANRLKELRQKVGSSHIDIDGFLGTKESPQTFDLQRGQT